MRIYHGSSVEVPKPLLSKGKPNNDYGRGFYCTEDIEMAREWACKGKEPPGFVNIYCQNGGTGAVTVGATTPGAIRVNGDLYIHGGNVSASGGISASNGSVHIRWATPENSVTAGSYGANVEFEDSFVTYDTGDPALTSNAAALAGKKLVPAYKVSFDAGDGTGTMSAVYVPVSSPSYTLPGCTFEPPANTEFDHWELLEDASSTTVSSPYTLTKRNTTFIAKYETVQTPQPEDVSWAIENGVLTISGTGTMEDYGRGASPWFARRAEITSVVIGSGVSHIGNYAFYACGAVESVTIRGTGVTVGDRAFAYCCGLSTVTLGENATVASVGEGAFYACFKLRNKSFADGATAGSKAYDLCGLGD